MGIIKPYNTNSSNDNYIWMHAKEGITNTNFIKPISNEYLETFNFWLPVNAMNPNFLTTSVTFAKQKDQQILIASKHKHFLENIIFGKMLYSAIFFRPMLSNGGNVGEAIFDDISFFYRIIYASNVYTSDHIIQANICMSNLQLLTK